MSEAHFQRPIMFGQRCLEQPCEARLASLRFGCWMFITSSGIGRLAAEVLNAGSVPEALSVQPALVGFVSLKLIVRYCQGRYYDEFFHPLNQAGFT